MRVIEPAHRTKGRGRLSGPTLARCALGAVAVRPDGFWLAVPVVHNCADVGPGLGRLVAPNRKAGPNLLAAQREGRSSGRAMRRMGMGERCGKARCTKRFSVQSKKGRACKLTSSLGFRSTENNTTLWGQNSAC